MTGQRVETSRERGRVAAPSFTVCSNRCLFLMLTKCWKMLGSAHAEHDEDRKAIMCLERAVAEDPYHLEALLALGVSYVNELDSAKALRSLRVG